MKQVWKFPIEPGCFTHVMPFNARILSVHMQNGKPFFWAECDPDAKKHRWYFETVPTGVPSTAVGVHHFCGTFMPESGLVFHLYVARVTCPLDEATND